MRRLVLLSTLFLAAIACLRCDRPMRVPLQIATNVWPGYEPLHLAANTGLLDAKRFRLVEMPNATDAMRALGSGLVQGATLTLDETLTLLQDGVPLRVVLVMDYSNGADTLLGGTGVRTLKDLKGRRIGVENHAVGAYLLSRALEHAGLTPAEVTIVPVAKNVHEQVFRSGTIDALVTYEPTRSRLLSAGANEVFESSRIPREIMDVLVVRAEVLRGHPAAAEELRKAWFQALDQLARDPLGSARIMAPREGVEPAAFLESLRGLDFPDRAADRSLRDGGLLRPTQRLADTMLRNRLLARPVDPAALLSPP